MDNRAAVTTTDTSMSFTGLEEFSTYTVTVTTTFNVFGGNMTEVAEQRAINQDAVIIPIIWQGNMVCSNRKLQGVITASG